MKRMFVILLFLVVFLSCNNEKRSDLFVYGEDILDFKMIVGLSEKGEKENYILIPNGYAIGTMNVFEGCDNLEIVEFEGNNFYDDIIDNFINYGAFKDCKNLKKIIFHFLLKEVRSYSFYGCKNLSEMTFIFDSNAKIREWAFAESGIRKIIFEGDYYAEIYPNAFWGCDNIIEIFYPYD